jgi:hypothetical protein
MNRYYQMKQFLQGTFFLFACFFAEGQKKYYFRGLRQTSNVEKQDGSKQRPFESLGAFRKLKLKAGDSVFFKSGDVFRGQINITDIHGTVKQPIVFTTYGKGKAFIYSGLGDGISIKQSSHFSFHNIVLQGLGRKEKTGDGIKLINCSSIRINEVEVSGYQKAGVLLYNCQDALIDGVIAQDNGFAGIFINGEYQKRLSERIHITSSRADNNPGDPTNLTNHSGNGILVGNCKHVLIEYCSATNNGWDMPRTGNGPVGIWAYEADSIIIQHCLSYRNKTSPGAADGGGFDLDGGVTNSIIQYCLSYENEGAGYGIFEYPGANQWKNNTVRYCISINDGRKTENAAAMYIWNGWDADSMLTDFYAYNNFFYNDTKYSFSFAPQSRHKRFYFFNNIFVASDSSDMYYGIDRSNSDIFLNNVWMLKNGGFRQNDFNDLEQWARKTGNEMKDGKFYGIGFDSLIFDLPKYIDATDLYRFKTNPILSKVCNNSVREKGLDIKKMFGIDPGKKDFFGNSLRAGKTFDPGVCAMD